jgi:cupin fold WbuC family metalloprotein
MIKNFSSDFLDSLSDAAEASIRHRQHHNIHQSYDEPCQRLFNAIGVDSYIRPHRHASSSINECLIAIRGMMTLVLFDEAGGVSEFIHFGVQSENELCKVSVGVEIPPECWHTVVANVPGSVLFELKEGPFNPQAAKEYAEWAPKEGSENAQHYLDFLKSLTSIH